MISDFLKRQKETLQDKLVSLEKQLSVLKTEKEETQKFIMILDEGRDKLLRSVSPYSPEDEDEKKICELKKKQHTTEEEICKLSDELQSLTKLLAEYDEYIDDAFDLEFMKGKYDRLSKEESDTEEKNNYNLNLLSEYDQEKTNTAKELFDSFSPLFTIATHRLDIAKKFMDIDPERSKREIVDVSDTMENCISEMNRILSMISPIDYQNKTLKQALEQECLRMRETFGIKVYFNYQIDVDLTSKLICSSIFQMVQEVCSCMVMREKPDEVKITLSCIHKREQIQIKVYISSHCKIDSQPVSNGFNSQEWYHQNLCLAKEKIYLLDGDLEVKSRTPENTDIVISIPYIN